MKLIDPAADEHMGVGRRQFPGIYMPAAWPYEGRLRLQEDDSVV